MEQKEMKIISAMRADAVLNMSNEQIKAFIRDDVLERVAKERDKMEALNDNEPIIVNVRAEYAVITSHYDVVKTIKAEMQVGMTIMETGNEKYTF